MVIIIGIANCICGKVNFYREIVDKSVKVFLKLSK